MVNAIHATQVAKKAVFYLACAVLGAGVILFISAPTVTYTLTSFESAGENSWKAKLPELSFLQKRLYRVTGDNDPWRDASRLKLYEDGKLLPLRNGAGDIPTGGGYLRFSADSIIFSTSDALSPKNTDRVYTAEITLQPRKRLSIVIAMAVLVMLLTTLDSSRAIHSSRGIHRISSGAESYYLQYILIFCFSVLALARHEPLGIDTVDGANYLINGISRIANGHELYPYPSPLFQIISALSSGYLWYDGPPHSYFLWRLSHVFLFLFAIAYYIKYYAFG